jgi:hypothetical protein
VVAPQVPAGGAVGQAVFDHQADGAVDDPPGVVAPRWGQVGEVGAEVKVAGLAAMLGVKDVEVQWPVAARAAAVVEEAPSQGVPLALNQARFPGPRGERF